MNSDQAMITELGGKHLAKTKTTSSTRYICYVAKCPICDLPGWLKAKWVIYKPTGNEWGPYFFISHPSRLYNAQKYRELRKKGVEVQIAGRAIVYQYYDPDCSFGKDLPRIKASELKAATKRLIKLGIS